LYTSQVLLTATAKYQSESGLDTSLTDANMISVTFSDPEIRDHKATLGDNNILKQYKRHKIYIS
jgi:hypothetical protein